jgi:putative ABC transport system permease protein
MFKHYLTTALRHFARRKTTTAINAFSLSFGLTCFAMAYGLTQSFTHADSFHEKSDRTFVLMQRNEYFDARTSGATAPLAGWGIAKYLKAEYPQLEIVARALRAEEMSIATSVTKNFAQVSFADPEFLEVFDLPFVAGNSRTALSTPHSAVIADQLAIKLFGTTDVIDKTVLLSNREMVRITGIMSTPRQPSHISFSGSNGGLQFTLLVSMDTWEVLRDRKDPSAGESRAQYFQTNALTYLVFPKNGQLTPEHLRQDLPRFAAAIIPKEQARATFGLRPAAEIIESIGDIVIRRDKTGVSTRVSNMLFGALLLLAACLNYANLASAQATTRLKETALRRVVGAGRLQIVAQAFFEALLLVLLAAGLSLAMLPTMVKAVQTRTGFEIGPLLFGSSDFWLATLITIILVTLLACSYPAWTTARINPGHALQSGRTPLTKRRTMYVLVVLQFVSASFLLVLTSVINSQNDRMRPSLSDISSDPIAVISNQLNEQGIDIQALQNELRRQPSIRSVSAIDVAPGRYLNHTSGIVQLTADPASRRWILTTPAIDYDFFSTMGIKLLAGREFDRAVGTDVATASNPGNVVIDQATAQQYGWHTPQEAIGQAIYLPKGGAAASSLTIQRTVVGVVENKMLYPLALVGSLSTVYSVAPARVSAVVVRIAKEDVDGGVRAIDTVWSQVAPNAPLQRRFWDEEFDDAYTQITSATGMFPILSLFALLIGSMGLVGIATHAMAQRRFEIGVRRTLGASVRQILVMLLKDFSAPIVVANLIAWPFAFVIAKSYTAMFSDKAPLTLLPFAMSLLTGLVIAWLAVLKQATSAARMHPARVLRHE